MKFQVTTAMMMAMDTLMITMVTMPGIKVVMLNSIIMAAMLQE